MRWIHLLATPHLTSSLLATLKEHCDMPLRTAASHQRRRERKRDQRRKPKPKAPAHGSDATAPSPHSPHAQYPHRAQRSRFAHLRGRYKARSFHVEAAPAAQPRSPPGTPASAPRSPARPGPQAAGGPYLQSRCFFLGPITSWVVALQTALATAEPVTLCCAAVMRSVIDCPDIAARPGGGSGSPRKDGGEESSPAPRAPQPRPGAGPEAGAVRGEAGCPSLRTASRRKAADSAVPPAADCTKAFPFTFPLPDKMAAAAASGDRAPAPPRTGGLRAVWGCDRGA